MQGYRVACACRLMICSQIPEVAASYNSKCCVGRHFGVQPRSWVAALPLRPLGARGGFASCFRGWWHCCSPLSGL